MMTPRQQPGFSLVEVIIAMMILSVGVLAMGASTGHIMAQIQAAELRTERMSAVREAAELLRSTDWADLDATCESAPDRFGTTNYVLTCRVDHPSDNLKRVHMVTSGPGFKSGRFTTTVADTFSISIAKPVE